MGSNKIHVLFCGYGVHVFMLIRVESINRFADCAVNCDVVINYAYLG
jgi:hypothetical protein